MRRAGGRRHGKRRDTGLAARAILGIGAVVFHLALAAPVAGADAGFSAPEYLSPPDGSILHAPDVAVAADDTAMAVWSRYASGVTRVEAVRIAADGTPGRVLTLSESAESAWSPKVALDADGNATVVWYQGSGSHRIMAVRVGADDVPGPVHTLASGRVPEVVVDSHGRATVVWYSGGGITLRVQAVRLDDEGTPGTVRTLSASGAGGFLPRAAVDSQDRVTVVWSGDEYVQAVRIGADGVPGPILNLSRRTYGQGLPDLAVDSLDRVTAVWQEEVEPADREHSDDWRRVKSTRIGADGSPGPVRTLSEAGQALGPKVAIDAHDRAVVVWEDQLPRAAMSVRVGADGTLGAVQTLGSATGDMGTPVVATDRSGGATAVWHETLSSAPDPDGAIGAVHIGRKDDLGPLHTLSDAGGGAYHSSPALAIDSRNRVTVVWKRSDGSGGGRIQMARGGGVLEPPVQEPPVEPPLDPPGPPLDPPGPPFDPPGPPSTRPPFDHSRAAKAHARLRLSRRGIVRGRRVLLRAACRSPRPCRGRMAIVARRRPRGAAHAQLVVIARGRYRLGSRAHGVVRARLSPRGRRLLLRPPRRALVAQARAAGSRQRIRLRTRD